MWNALPGERIREDLGGSVRILHIGCGNGRYLPVFENVFGPVDSYTGIDHAARRDWSAREKQDGRTRFVAMDPADITMDVLGQNNVIVSQGALEHVRDDLRMFRALAQLIETRGSPVFQLHLVPGQHLWKLYGPHGYRGYHEGNLRPLAECFRRDTHVRFAALGGPSCNRVHLTYLANAWDRLTGRSQAPDRRWSDAKDYIRALRVAMNEDENAPPPVNLENANSIGMILQTRMSVPVPAC